jgi:hypothetical protein
MDTRSMRQKIMDPRTVAEINEMRDYSTVLMDWVSRSLGPARHVVTGGLIAGSLALYALDVVVAVS